MLGSALLRVMDVHLYDLELTLLQKLSEDAVEVCLGGRFPTSP